MFRVSCSVSLSQVEIFSYTLRHNCDQDWRSNPEVDMAEIELDSEDLNLVDDIFNAVAFDVDGQVSAGDVRHILEEMKDRQITQVCMNMKASLYKLQIRAF